MATAAEFVKDMLQEITQLGTQQPIEASDAQACKRRLNRLGAEWNELFPLGFTKLEDLGDEVTIPAYADQAFISTGAIRIASIFGKSAQVPGSLIATAQDAFKNLLSAAVSVEPSQYPSTLPVGSGNECGALNRRFYPGSDGEILLETGGSILTEVDTE